MRWSNKRRGPAATVEEIEAFLRGRGISVRQPPKRVDGYDNYFVTDNGIVVSSAHKNLRVLAHLVSRDGYHRVCLKSEGAAKNKWVHRLVLEAFVSPIPSSDSQTRHLDRNTHNNAVENLKWGTAKENADDRVRHGTSPIGQLNPRAKLDPIAVRIIRDVQFSTKALAWYYGVARTLIQHIRRGEIWANVS